MENPKAVVYDTSGCPKNFIKSPKQNTVYPNFGKLDKFHHDSVLMSQAQEIAYWTQLETPMFAINKEYENHHLEVKGYDPFFTKPPKSLMG